MSLLTNTSLFNDKKLKEWLKNNKFSLMVRSN